MEFDGRGQWRSNRIKIMVRLEIFQLVSSINQLTSIALEMLENGNGRWGTGYGPAVTTKYETQHITGVMLFWK